MCEKISFCLFLIFFLGSDEDGADIGSGGRCSRGVRLRHSNTTARNSDGMMASSSMSRWDTGDRSGFQIAMPVAHRQARPSTATRKQCLVDVHSKSQIYNR